MTLISEMIPNERRFIENFDLNFEILSKFCNNVEYDDTQQIMEILTLISKSIIQFVYFYTKNDVVKKIDKLYRLSLFVSNKQKFLETFDVACKMTNSKNIMEYICENKNVELIEYVTKIGIK